MAEPRPTDQARDFFASAVLAASTYKSTKNDAELGEAVKKLAQGLFFEAIGLRATYILLEEVKALLQRQR